MYINLSQILLLKISHMYTTIIQHITDDVSYICNYQ